MPETFRVCIEDPATHVDVQPGGEIILRGSFYSAIDASTIGAATTSWQVEPPSDAPVDREGFLDFSAGGFRLTSRDANTHEAHAIATGDPAPLCGKLGVAAPCLVSRRQVKAVKRVNPITGDELSSSLPGPKGDKHCFTMDVPSAIIVVPPKAAASLQWAGGLLGVAALGALAWVVHRRRAASPAGQLRAMAKRVRVKLKSADSVLAAPLVPAIESALKAIDERRVDAASTEGKRVMAVLTRVDAQIDATAIAARAEQEQAAADELVHEVESALEAAAEAQMIGNRATK